MRQLLVNRSLVPTAFTPPLLPSTAFTATCAYHRCPRILSHLSLRSSTCSLDGEQRSSGWMRSWSPRRRAPPPSGMCHILSPLRASVIRPSDCARWDLGDELFRISLPEDKRVSLSCRFVA